MRDLYEDDPFGDSGSEYVLSNPSGSESESERDEGTINATVKTRKPIRNEQMWPKNIMKAKRIKGEEYRNFKGYSLISRKKIRKKDTIINPQEYLDLFSESGSVQVLGVNWKVYDWQEQVKAHVRATSLLPFKINSCKRVMITKNTKGNVIVQGEPFYKHLIGTAQGICKKRKTFYDINPDEMSTGHRKIKPEKIKNVDELLTDHFGSTWKEEAENLGLQYYRDVLSDENRGNEKAEEVQEELLCDPQEDKNKFV
ncbi:unnamed protein product [Psylliodes chrysocephalus]|uniref:Uncharacterized protein n=1 Tax=Psylliodes chrysocephalus TaxID=3402493 RepID=A0A9P0CE58_9CUCU|nr:unnamed protein product [Psylliodes chrysocephala]